MVIYEHRFGKYANNASRRLSTKCLIFHSFWSLNKNQMEDENSVIQSVPIWNFTTFWKKQKRTTTLSANEWDGRSTKKLLFFHLSRKSYQNVCLLLSARSLSSSIFNCRMHSINRRICNIFLFQYKLCIVSSYIWYVYTHFRCDHSTHFKVNKQTNPLNVNRLTEWRTLSLISNKKCVFGREWFWQIVVYFAVVCRLMSF